MSRADSYAGDRPIGHGRMTVTRAGAQATDRPPNSTTAAFARPSPSRRIDAAQASYEFLLHDTFSGVRGPLSANTTSHCDWHVEQRQVRPTSRGSRLSSFGGRQLWKGLTFGGRGVSQGTLTSVPELNDWRKPASEESAHA